MCVLGIKDELFGCWYKTWECPNDVKVVDRIVRVARGVNVRPNPRTRHEPDTGFFGL